MITKMILSAIDKKMVLAWEEFFKDEANVTIVEGDITEIICDAVISPANSFGFMDGGLDYALSVRLGWDLEKQLQKRIKELPEGELLVGQAMVLETGDSKVPYLISAPTMRVPTNFNIGTSLNAYLAMKAILIQATRHENINTIAVPGLCTGVGRMMPVIAARQMHLAYREIIHGEKQDFKNFAEAQKYHHNINPQGMLWTH